MRAASWLVGGPLGRLFSSDLDAVDLPPDEAPEWSQFEAYNTQQIYRVGRGAALIVVGFILLWWPVDLLTNHREPAAQEVFTTWRLGALACFASMYLALRFWPFARWHPALVCGFFSVAAATLVAYELGRLGGPDDDPFFFLLCGGVIIPGCAPTNVPTRLLFMLSVGAGMVFGYFGLHPAYLRSPRLAEALLFLGSMLFGILAANHAYYVTVCQRYFQSLSLAQAALDLKALNGALDERVREKTVELRRLADHLQIVQEDERGRIARELHDELGQRLSALRYGIALSRQRFASDQSSVSPGLDELDAMVAGALDSAHHIVQGLRPPLLKQLGLASAIAWLGRQLEERSGIACRLDLPGDDVGGPALTEPIALTAFRVLQESLTNVTRHAGAGRVEIRMRVSPDLLQLDVTDDGRGFTDAAAAGHAGRHGILGMRERALALGGQLRTDNLPTGGARVRLLLPVTPQPLEPEPHPTEARP
jgi:signal transduction histidine kinase